MSLRPYLAGFRLALSQELVHRANFFVGRLRDFILFAALVVLFQHVPRGVQNWDQSALLTYTVLSAFVSTQISAQGMNSIADEITEGDLTNFLLRPMNYLGYWTARLLAVRLLSLIGGLFSVGVLLALFSWLKLTLPRDLMTWLIAGGLFLLSVVMMQILDFIGGSLSFWTDRAYGPRFLLLFLVQFLSGAYLPIDALPSWIQKVLSFTPFPSLIFAPVSTLVRGVNEETPQVFAIQLFWILLLGTLLSWVWRRGLKKYAAYGR